MTDEARSRRTAALFVTLAATLWSTGGVGVKVTTGEPLVIAGLRSVFALLFMGGVLFVQTRFRGVPELLKRWRSWGAAVAYALMVICFVLAARRTTAANAIFLQYTAPVYVALLSGPLLGERVTGRDIACVLACVVGMGLAFGGELGEGRAFGNVLAILSSFGFAGLPLFIRLDQKEGELSPHAPLVAMVLGNLIASIVALPAIAVHPPTDTKTWVVVAALGFFQIGLPYVFYGIAVRRLRALESSLLATIEPVLSPVWVVLATGERPSPLALAGGAVIVACVAVQATGRARVVTG
jgi:drug/metabolite transporter (DMT)-like permease